MQDLIQNQKQIVVDEAIKTVKNINSFTDLIYNLDAKKEITLVDLLELSCNFFDTAKSLEKTVANAKELVNLRMIEENPSHQLPVF